MDKNIHIVPKGERWAVKEVGKEGPISTHRTQELARQAGIPVAKQNRSELVIHNKGGKFRDKDSYGNDPNPPKDKKH